MIQVDFSSQVRNDSVWCTMLHAKSGGLCGWEIPIPYCTLVPTPACLGPGKWNLPTHTCNMAIGCGKTCKMSPNHWIITWIARQNRVATFEMEGRGWCVSRCSVPRRDALRKAQTASLPLRDRTLHPSVRTAHCRLCQLLLHAGNWRLTDLMVWP